MKMNFYEELLQMRENYKNNPLEDIKLNRPSWLDSSDPMSEIYSKKSLLLQHGEIVNRLEITVDYILMDSVKTNSHIHYDIWN